MISFAKHSMLDVWQSSKYASGLLKLFCHKVDICQNYDYSCADWDGLHDHLTDVPWEDIFKLVASAAAKEFCEWVQVGIDVYTLHRKY